MESDGNGIREGVEEMTKDRDWADWLDYMADGFGLVDAPTAREVASYIRRLHSWDGLMELLDEHWPEDIFPTIPFDGKRDAGPRIVALLRWNDQLLQQLRGME